MVMPSRRSPEIVFLLLFAFGFAAGQQQVGSRPASAPAQVPATSAASPNLGQLAQTLNGVDQFSQRAGVDLARLRIEKWKTGSEHKQQAQADADSLIKNLSAALPEMTAAVRANPGALGPGLKLYRDLNALYDVLGGVAESAGAFGPREDYDALAADQQSLDAARRSLGDFLENLAAYKDAEVLRLRTETAAANPANAPKKVIVDDAPEPVHHAGKRAKAKPRSAAKTTTPASASTAAKPSPGTPQNPQ